MRLDFEGRKAYLRQIACDYYTERIHLHEGDGPRHVAVDGVSGFRLVGGSGEALATRAPRAKAAARPRTRRTANYPSRRVWSASRNQVLHQREHRLWELDLPEQQMHTTADWLTISTTIIAALPYASDDRRDGVVGLSFAMRQRVAQLLLICDRHYIASRSAA